MLRRTIVKNKIRLQHRSMSKDLYVCDGDASRELEMTLYTHFLPGHHQTAVKLV